MTQERNECYCPVHGKVHADYCVACETQKYVLLRNLGFIRAFMLLEGPGPEPKDPSPQTIRYRAFLERKKRMHKDLTLKSRNGGTYWQQKVRVVRSIPDHFFEDIPNDV